MDQRVAGGPTDSPIPEGFGIPDLMDLVDRLEVGHRSGEGASIFHMNHIMIFCLYVIRVQVDKEGEAGAQRKVTRAIKFLCHSEESLRLGMSVLKTGFQPSSFHIL